RLAGAGTNRSPPISSPRTTTTAACWSRLRRVHSSEFALDPRLQLLERHERVLELPELGVSRPLVEAAEQAERLEPVDRRRAEVVAGAPFDLGLTQLRA